MCLGLYGEQPIAIDLTMESIQPVVPAGKAIASSIQITQSFDLLIRNCGNVPIRSLTALHSRNFVHSPNQALGATLLAWDTAWVGKPLYGRREGENATDNSGGTCYLPVDRAPYPGCPQGTDHVIARRLTPARVLLHPAITPAHKSLFKESWPTPLQIELAEDLQPFDPANEQQTTYLLCLAFGLPNVKPEAEQRIEVPFPEYAHSPLRKTLRTLSTFDPSTGWAKFDKKLGQVGGAHAPLAAALRDQFITHGVRQPDHATRWRDIRIHVVTGHQCSVHDDHETGAVGLWEVRNLRESAKAGNLPRYAHVWVAGDDYYPQYDPIAVAQRILDCTRAYYRAGKTYLHLDDFWGPVSNETAVNVLTILGILTDMAYFQVTVTNDRETWMPIPARLPAPGGMSATEQVALEREVSTRLAARRLQDPGSFTTQGFRIMYTLENYDLRPH